MAVQAIDGGFTQARDEMNDISEKLKGRNKSATSPGWATRTSRSAAGGRENSAQQPATDAVTLQDLMRTPWNRDEEPVAYLPSANNDCEIENQRMLCNTAERVRENAGNHIRYRTRSIISDLSKDGSFRIVYRNLVISSTPIERNVATQGETGAGYAIKTGWGKQHTLECVLKDDTTISCMKDSTYAFDLSSQQKLAAGR